MRRWESLRQLWAPFIRSPISLYAAGASFYMLLSALPASAFFLALLPYLPVTQTTWTQILEQAFPAPFLPIVFALLQAAAARRSAAMLSLSALTALWSASKGILALMDGLNAVLSMRHTKLYILRRLTAIAYFLLLEAGLLAMLGLYVFGRQLLDGCLQWFPGFSELMRLLLQLRAVYTVLPFGFLFAAVFYFLPARRLRFRYCLAGGVFSAAGWLILSLGFSIYVNYISNMDRLYGGLGMMLLAAFWVHSCMVLVLCGGLLAQLLASGQYRPLLILKDTFSGRS